MNQKIIVLDHGALDAKTIQVTTDPQTGKRTLTARVTYQRVGILEYQEDGKTYRDLLPSEHYLTPAYLQTINGAPVTDEHPGTVDGLLTGQEERALYARGTTHGDVIVVDNDHLDGTVTVYDQALIDSIMSGEKQQVSVGRRAERVMLPGVWNGQPYDRVQINPVFNHLAFTRRGRCGDACRIHLDSGAALAGEQNAGNRNNGQRQGVQNMEKYTLTAGGKTLELHLCDNLKAQGITKEMLDEFQKSVNTLTGKVQDSVAKADHQTVVDKLAQVQAALEKAQAGEPAAKILTDVGKALDSVAGKDALEKATKAVAEIQRLTGELNTSKGLLDANKTVVDGLQGQIKTLQQRDVVAEVQAFNAVVTQAQQALGDSYAWQGKSMRDIKVDFLCQLQGKKPEEFKDTPQATVDAAFDALAAFRAQLSKQPFGTNLLAAPKGQASADVDKNKQARTKFFGAQAK